MPMALVLLATAIAGVALITVVLVTATIGAATSGGCKRCDRSMQVADPPKELAVTRTD